MAENITYFIAAASAVGTIANSFQKKWCFYVWGVTNAFWIIHNFRSKQYAQALLYTFNFATCIIGLLKWEKKSFWEGFKKASCDLHKLEKPRIDTNEARLFEIFSPEVATEMIRKGKTVREITEQYIK